jgi:AraC-like DNA-binding protein
MRVMSFAPTERLAPFVRAFTVVEADEETTRLLIPDGGIVLGFRYRGHATLLNGGPPTLLPDATLAGLHHTARRMRTSAGGGIVLATFHEAGAARFFPEPLHELFGRTAALDDLVPLAEIERVSSLVASATGHAERLAIVEQFLLGRRGTQGPDPIVAVAARAIRRAGGSIRIGALAAELGIGLDRLEKRFRRAVGATPKQLASTIRLRHLVDSYRPGKSLARLAMEAGYFDQSHFIRDFRSVTGESPQDFFRADDHC